MRILLQHKETGLYFKDIDSWVRTGGEAMDFLSSTAAIDFCVANKLSEVQLVLKFDEQRYDIVLPVRPLQEQGTERARETG
jgi:type II secretory pathway component PulL